MNNKKITVKDLRAIPPYEIFGTGKTLFIKWVAQKLPNHHWTVYIGNNIFSDKEIIATGNTVLFDTVRELIDCDDKALERYVVENEYSCKRHNLDYRITCEECQKKYLKFSKKIKETIKDNGKNI